MNAARARQARSTLKFRIRDVARAACVSPDTVSRFERGQELRPATIMAIRSALERAGADFTEAGSGSAGVKLCAHV
jgi:transcriptional regulator with XRE-family HTH domain